MLDEDKTRQATDEGNCGYRVKGPRGQGKLQKSRPTHDEDMA